VTDWPRGGFVIYQDLDENLCRDDELSGQGRVQRRDLRPHFALKRLQLIDSGGEVAAIQRGSGDLQTGEQRLRILPFQIRFVKQCHYDAHGFGGRYHFHRDRVGAGVLPVIDEQCDFVRADVQHVSCRDGRGDDVGAVQPRIGQRIIFHVAGLRAVQHHSGIGVVGRKDDEIGYTWKIHQR